MSSSAEAPGFLRSAREIVGGEEVVDAEEVDARGATDDVDEEAEEGESNATPPRSPGSASSFPFTSLGSARLRSRAAAAAEASSRSVVEEEPGRVATHTATIGRRRRDTTSLPRAARLPAALAGAAALRGATPCLTGRMVDLMSDSRGGRLVRRDGAGEREADVEWE